ncbi:MAG: HD domain-containing protein [Marinobacter sp.]|uniref:HD domain-containing protein n=1 Tax=Marinobacter sp. TaxID=50741 RepID=UPI00299E33E6|nr:HD domain-containing protein [Marinobacter sp.]MDX1635469.1 HD domain-containing protein [Marinobacter sp.]
MTERLDRIAEFLLQLDALKSVDRRTYINGGERLENSAEHSWHLAMACWAFAEQSQEDFDLSKLLRLALLHDLGEIGAGDTFLYSDQRSDAHLEERRYIGELASHPGNPIGDLPELWDEQEAGESREARLLKVIDRLLPFLHNLASQGRAWKDHGIRKSQVLRMHGFIEQENPEVYRWLRSKVDYAVAQGWLENA